MGCLKVTYFEIELQIQKKAKWQLQFQKFQTASLGMSPDVPAFKVRVLNGHFKTLNWSNV